MTVNDLPTVGYLDQWFRALHAELKATQQAAPAPAEVVLYSVVGLAQVLSCDPSTVRRWLREGKQVRDAKGRPQTVKLQAYYAMAEARIPWPAFLAYERGEAFDLSKLPAPTAAPPKAGAPVALPEEPTMRLAS
ncbi:MAG: hypothetical protein ACRYFK_16620 [Janthinobacterium lividum]